MDAATGTLARSHASDAVEAGAEIPNPRGARGRAHAANPAAHSGLIRIGGLAGFLCIALFILINWVLKEFPPMDGPSPAELQAYLTREAGTWAVVHALRFVVFAIFPLYVVGLFLRIRSRGVPAANGWGIVGLVAATMLGTAGFVTNTLETFTFLDDPLVSGNPDLFWLLFWITRFLFTAVVLFWGMVLVGFSVGGLRSGALPRWLAGAGVAVGALDVVHSVFLVSVMTGGWATALTPVVGLSSVAWFGTSGVFLMLRGST